MDQTDIILFPSFNHPRIRNIADKKRETFVDEREPTLNVMRALCTPTSRTFDRNTARTLFDHYGITGAFEKYLASRQYDPKSGPVPQPHFGTPQDQAPANPPVNINTTEKHEDLVEEMSQLSTDNGGNTIIPGTQIDNTICQLTADQKIHDAPAQPEPEQNRAENPSPTKRSHDSEEPSAKKQKAVGDDDDVLMNEKKKAAKSTADAAALMNGGGDDVSVDSKQSQDLLSQLNEDDMSINNFPDGQTQELPPNLKNDSNNNPPPPSQDEQLGAILHVPDFITMFDISVFLSTYFDAETITQMPMEICCYKSWGHAILIKTSPFLVSTLQARISGKSICGHPFDFMPINNAAEFLHVEILTSDLNAETLAANSTVQMCKAQCPQNEEAYATLADIISNANSHGEIFPAFCGLLQSVPPTNEQV
jgi:hypothetical protein